MHQNKAEKQLNSQIRQFTKKISQKIENVTNNKKKLDHSL